GKGSAYEGGVRVPLIVKAPGITPTGSVCDEPVMTIDFFPTLLELAGVPLAGRQLDGRSMVPLLADPTARLDRAELYWHYPHYPPGGATPYGAVRARDWRLIEFFEDMHVELYHIANDIGESRDLAAAEPERANQLRQQLHAWRDDMQAQMPTPNP